MKKNFLLSLLIVGALLASCKKKDNGLTAGGPAGPSSGFTNVYGTMTAQQFVSYYPTIPLLDTTYSAIAWFFNAPQNNWVFTGMNTTLSAGNVFVNSTGLKIYNIPGLVVYEDSTGILNLKTTTTWSVSGASIIPNFSNTVNLAWPVYTGYAALPDTIHKTQTNIIRLNGISLTDSISINIDDGSGTNGHSYTTIRTGSGTASITILPINTSAMNNTGTGRLSIQLFKFAPSTSVSGKNFIYVKNLEFQKIVEIDNY